MTEKQTVTVLTCDSPIDIDLIVFQVESALNGREYDKATIEALALQSVQEVEGYCNRLLDNSYVGLLAQITMIKLNRLGSEGLSAMSLSGVSESYINDYPDNIKAILKSKRKIKLL